MMVLYKLSVHTVFIYTDYDVVSTQYKHAMQPAYENGAGNMYMYLRCLSLSPIL